MDSDLLAHEMRVNDHFTLEVRLSLKKSTGTSSPGGTAQERSRPALPSTTGSANNLNQTTLTSWLKRSKSMNDVKTDTIISIETEAKEEAGIDAKKDIGKATATNSSKVTTPVSRHVFGDLKAGGPFTFRAVSPVNGTASDVKQPACSQDFKPFLDFLGATSTPSPSAADSLRRPSEVSPNPLVRQYCGEIAIHSPTPTPPQPRTSLSLIPRQETALPVQSSERNLLLGDFPLHGGQTAPGDGIFAGKLVDDFSRLSNNACGHAARAILHPKDERIGRPLQPEGPVRSFERGRTRSTSAIEAVKPNPQPQNDNWLPSPALTGPAGHKSPRPKKPKAKLLSSDVYAKPSDPQVCRSISSPAGRGRPVENTGMQTSSSEKDDDISDKTPSSENEFDSDDDSHALVPLSQSSGDDSISLRSSSPGSLNGTWYPTTRNLDRLPTFSWIVRAVCEDLTQEERHKGFIYAFELEDGRGKHYVKIGYTRKAIQERMERNLDCYGDCVLMYPPPGHEPVCVDHAGRVGRLICTELTEQAMWLMECPKHQNHHRRHGEWFDVEKGHALAVIQKWSQWIASLPYEKAPFADAFWYQEMSQAASSMGKGDLDEKSSETTSPKPGTQNAPREERWRLKELAAEDLMKVCWPLDPFDRDLDDGDFNEVGKRTQTRKITLEVLR